MDELLHEVVDERRCHHLFDTYDEAIRWMTRRPFNRLSYVFRRACDVTGLIEDHRVRP
jgi:hypothetical protein